MLSKSLLAAVGIAAFSTGTLAADLPPRVAPAVYIPPPAFTWAGVYLGVTAGYAEGFHTFNDLNGTFDGYPGLANTQSGGFAGGGTLGVNLQAGSLVYGLETDINWLSNRTTYLDPNVINNYQPYEFEPSELPRHGARPPWSRGRPHDDLFHCGPRLRERAQYLL